MAQRCGRCCRWSRHCGSRTTPGGGCAGLTKAARRRVLPCGSATGTWFHPHTRGSRHVWRSCAVPTRRHRPAWLRPTGWRRWTPAPLLIHPSGWPGRGSRRDQCGKVPVRRSRFRAVVGDGDAKFQQRLFVPLKHAFKSGVGFVFLGCRAGVAVDVLAEVALAVATAGPQQGDHQVQQAFSGIYFCGHTAHSTRREALALKDGDDIEITIAGPRTMRVARQPSTTEALVALRRLRGAMPPGFKFDRELASER